MERVSVIAGGGVGVVIAENRRSPAASAKRAGKAKKFHRNRRGKVDWYRLGESSPPSRSTVRLSHGSRPLRLSSLGLRSRATGASARPVRFPQTYLAP